MDCGRSIGSSRRRRDFSPATVAANRWNGALYALPWFVDVGMLYWRTDLVPAAPRDLDELVARPATPARASDACRSASSGRARATKGLVTVFLEHLGAFGGAILDEDGRVRRGRGRRREALTFMRDAIQRRAIVPAAVLTWQEEQARFAFQNGQAVFMRNWPYAYALLAATSAIGRRGTRSRVAPMPARAGRHADRRARRIAQLAINAYSDQPADAYALDRVPAAAGADDRARRGGRPVPAAARALRRPPRLRDALADAGAGRAADHRGGRAAAGHARLQRALRHPAGVRCTAR